MNGRSDDAVTLGVLDIMRGIEDIEMQGEESARSEALWVDAIC